MVAMIPAATPASVMLYVVKESEMNVAALSAVTQSRRFGGQDAVEGSICRSWSAVTWKPAARGKACGCAETVVEDASASAAKRECRFCIFSRRASDGAGEIGWITMSCQSFEYRTEGETRFLNRAM